MHGHEIAGLVRDDDVGALRALALVVRWLSLAAMALAAAGLLLALALIGWAVVLRYGFNAAPVWVDDLVGFLLVGIVMLAAADAFRRGEHIGVDLLTVRLGPRARRWALGWSAAAVLAVGAILVVVGWETATLARTLGLLTDGHLEWPTWWLMALMPLGGLLLALAATETLWRALADALPSAPGQTEAP